MYSDEASSGLTRKLKTESGAAPHSAPSSSSQNKHDVAGPPPKSRPLIDSYRPQRENYRSSSSLGPRPFRNSGQRPLIDSYRPQAQPASGYSHAPPKRKASDSSDYSVPAHHDSEPSRKRQGTGRKPNPLSAACALESPRTPALSSSPASTTSARPAHATSYHNEAYARAARGRVTDRYVDVYRSQERQRLRPDRSGPPPPRDYDYDYDPYPPHPRRNASLPSLHRHQARSPSPPDHHHRHQHQHHEQALVPYPTINPAAAAATGHLPSPKYLPPLSCTPGRIIWVKRLIPTNTNTSTSTINSTTPQSQNQSQNQGWRSHPGVILDAEDPTDARADAFAYVATTTSWSVYRGLDAKFAAAAAATRDELAASFCRVVLVSPTGAASSSSASGSSSALSSASSSFRGVGAGVDVGTGTATGKLMGEVPEVRIEGADVFEQETYVDGRAVRRVRKRELGRYVKKGTCDEAFVTAGSLRELKAHLRALASRGNGVWDRADLRDLRAWARWDEGKEEELEEEEGRRRKKKREEDGKEEGEISEGG
ncbi:uncharacterized protein BKCO1_6900020 [Diplodia corticola]|uniref:Uncharacterized protein n=1 Tax=Diplodia corticola TaxID=236234 RepID=A0A1J9QPG1_9PEZI|nr:uncharacterized protein BKCO1_6900020 [Diplodia corticola]OJD29938.1 hypothetical protein BKCO1_6900020 [Diplodia corticola]